MSKGRRNIYVILFTYTIERVLLPGKVLATYKIGSKSRYGLWFILATNPIVVLFDSSFCLCWVMPYYEDITIIGWHSCQYCLV
jgi:hypothetical protein